ncbi:hypothetical protein ACFUOZ_14075 [Paenarthrobacter sp. NPDC057355]|uniref:hypothetical protein n=1 Tax=Paenarthrobacter sp. NPDC057355 TaxID=3346105 RepID=UPI003641BF5C
MNNLIFWIIVCSWLIPMGIRMYNRSKARRLQNGNFPGPDYRQQNLPGPGYPPQGYPGVNYPPQNYPAQNYPAPDSPVQNYPGYQPGPAVIRPAEEAPQAAPPSNPSFPTAAAEPQGYRAKKLAELDAKFTNGQIAMEDYMKQRQEIMNG